MGKHLAGRVGFHGRGPGIGASEAGNGSAGSAEPRLPTPRASAALTRGLRALTLSPIRRGAEETEDQSRG